MVELLAPINNFETLQAAIDNGCNSVYFGLQQLNMRQSANNFELNQLPKVVSLCHSNNVRAYLTLNSIVFDDELSMVEKIVCAAKESGVDAIICWDMGVAQICRKYDIEIHLSTQASVANFSALKFYYDQGFKRFVLARELSIEQIKSIIDKIHLHKMDAEVECFVHGAMCVSVSGRCFISHMLFNQSANRGKCLQPCRREYLVKDKETGDELVIGNNYILSPKDLCALSLIPELKEIGVHAFKIEGRMKQADYVAKVVKVYKEAIDFYDKFKDDSNFTKLYDYFIDEKMNVLKEVFNRDFHTGFYEKVPSCEITDKYGSVASLKKVFIGNVKNFYKKINVAELTILTNEELKVGDRICVIGNTTGYKEQILKEMQHNGNHVDIAHQNDRVGIKLEFEVRPNDKVFVLR